MLSSKDCVEYCFTVVTYMASYRDLAMVWGVDTIDNVMT